jgi:hypothetical protein
MRPADDLAADALRRSLNPFPDDHPMNVQEVQAEIDHLRQRHQVAAKGVRDLTGLLRLAQNHADRLQAMADALADYLEARQPATTVLYQHPPNGRRPSCGT